MPAFINEVTGSKFRDVTQFGRVLGLGPRCRRFKSCHLDQPKRRAEAVSFYFNRTNLLTEWVLQARTHSNAGYYDVWIYRGASY